MNDALQQNLGPVRLKFLISGPRTQEAKFYQLSEAILLVLSTSLS